MPWAGWAPAGLRSSNLLVRAGVPGYTGTMFFFSNRVGCLGSLIISAIATAILFMIFAR